VFCITALECWCFANFFCAVKDFGQSQDRFFTGLQQIPLRRTLARVRRTSVRRDTTAQRGQTTPPDARLEPTGALMLQLFKKSLLKTDFIQSLMFSSTKPGLKDMTECDKCDPGFFCNSTAQGTVSGPCQSGYYCPAGSVDPRQVLMFISTISVSRKRVVSPACRIPAKWKQLLLFFDC